MRTNHRLSWLLWLLAFVAGPVLAQVRFSQWVSSHPGPAVVAIIGYEIVVVIAAFLGKVYAQLETEWVHRTARYIDAWITRALSQYRRKYRKHLIELHRDVDIGWLSIRAPFGLPLEQVFVDLSVVSRLPHKLSSNPISTDEQSPSSNGPSTFELTGRESVWEFLNGHSRVVLAIVGAPGSGKTTLLKHIALALCDSNQRRKIAKAPRSTIPILLYLRDQAASISANCDAELTDLVCKSLRRILHPAAGKWFDNQLRAGRCLVMLDGLDEVAIQSERRDVVKWVEAQIARYPRCSFIVTSRRDGYWEAPLKAATVLQVRALNPNQIEHFVNLWFLATELRTTGRNDSAVRERARSKALDLLNRLSEASALRDLAANPLLLTMIANVHDYGGTLPKSRVRLYREICHVFLGRRDEQKGLASGDIDVDKKELVLRYLAFNMMSRHRRTLLQSDAEAVIAIPLQNVKPDLSASGYLELVKRDSGLVVEDDNGVIAFVHLSLQEYLTAVQIREHGSLKDLTDNITENWWRETILMYCAQADTGPIVRACLDINSPLALALAADCVDVALELAPVWRKAVEDALSTQRVSQDKQARLIAGGALLERKLRRLIRLENDTYLVNTPVSNAEYLFFAESAEIRRSTRPPGMLGGSPVVGENGSDLVIGVTASNALALASWVTSYLADGWTYRLPNSDEASDPGISRVVDVSRYGFWNLSKVSVSSRGTVYVTQPRLNSEAASISISSRELVNCMLNEFDWVKIARSIRELGPDTRRDLGTYWVSSGRLAKSWPVKGPVADLLELSNLVVALSEADLRRFLTLILTSRRLALKEAEELVRLVELLQSALCYLVIGVLWILRARAKTKSSGNWTMMR